MNVVIHFFHSFVLKHLLVPYVELGQERPMLIYYLGIAQIYALNVFVGSFYHSVLTVSFHRILLTL